jgi:heat shock protein HtpX
MPFETDRNWRLALGSLHTSANLVQAGVLLAAFGALVALASWPLIGAAAIVVAGLAIAAIVALALRLPPRVVMRLYGARLHERGALKQVDGLVAELAQRAALVRCPVLYVVPSSLLSAFSVATEHTAAIAVTEGLLRRLTMREIAAVLAREVAHVGLGDLLLLGIADVVTRFAQVLYYIGLGLTAINLWSLLTGEELVAWWTIALLILAPALLNLLQLRLPRTREYATDRAAALITGDPLGLASAISRLETSTGSFYDDLIPPVPARRVPQPSMLRCPPPAERRIDRLRALEAPPMPPLDIEEGPRISLVGVGPIEMRPRYRWPGVWF